MGMGVIMKWAVLLLSVCGGGLGQSVNHYYMNELCGSTINLQENQAEALMFSLTSKSRYSTGMNCTITFKGYPDHRFMFVFEMFDIMYTPNCEVGDYLKIIDGDVHSRKTVYQFPDPICGQSVLPHAHTNGYNDITFWFVSQGGQGFNRRNRGFRILLTVSHKEPCTQEEYRCSNGECISDTLVCDGYNHCGDFNGSCFFSVFGIALVCAGIALVVSVIALLIACCACCRNRARYTTPYVIKNSDPHYSLTGQTHYTVPAYGAIPNATLAPQTKAPL